MNILADWTKVNPAALMLLASVAWLSMACHDVEWTYRRMPQAGMPNADSANSTAIQFGGGEGGTGPDDGSAPPNADPGGLGFLDGADEETVKCVIGVLFRNNVKSPENAPVQLNARRFMLRVGASNLSKSYLGLTRFFGRSLESLMEDATDTCKPFQLPYFETQSLAFRCDPETVSWVPYGITTTYDATATGVYEGHHAIAISWHHVSLGLAEDRTAIRVSFVNLDDLENVTYLNALLVETTPDGDLRIFEGKPTGGIVWYGKHLFVTDAENGIRIFDVTQMLTTSELKLLGGKENTYDGDAILPQVGVLTGDGEPFSYSLISLDRAAPKDGLIVGEHHEQTSVSTDRIVRFALDPLTYLPEVDGNGISFGIEAYDTGQHELSGVVTRDAEFWFARRRREDGCGTIDFWRRGSPSLTSSLTAMRPASLCYAPDPEGHRLWVITEYGAGQSRVVLSVPRDNWD